MVVGRVSASTRAGIRRVGADVAAAIVAERDAHGPYTGIAELTERVQLARPVAEALATVGCFTSLDDGLTAAAPFGPPAPRPAPAPATCPASPSAPTLPGMSPIEVAAADLWATGTTPGLHPMRFIRDHLENLAATDGVPLVAAGRLLDVVDGTRVLVGGAVTHRQRPATAGGITFLSLEDETGLANVVVHATTWARFAQVLRSSSAVVVRGRAQVAQGAAWLIADRVTELDLRALAAGSRDFR
ncbi:helix-hairpin-helix domain-containing protein [Amycolatopsis sp. NPDC003865]